MCSDSINEIWLTTTELSEHHGVSPKYTLSRAPDLYRQGLARRTGNCLPGPGSNPWLFHPDCIPILTTPRPTGRPRKHPTVSQVRTMGLMKGESTEAIRKKVGVGWRVTDRWLRELKLKNKPEITKRIGGNYVLHRSE